MGRENYSNMLRNKITQRRLASEAAMKLRQNLVHNQQAEGKAFSSLSMEEMRAAFDEVDTDGSGEVSPSSIQQERKKERQTERKTDRNGFLSGLAPQYRSLKKTCLLVCDLTQPTTNRDRRGRTHCGDGEAGLPCRRKGSGSGDDRGSQRQQQRRTHVRGLRQNDVGVMATKRSKK